MFVNIANPMLFSLYILFSGGVAYVYGVQNGMPCYVNACLIFKLNVVFHAICCCHLSFFSFLYFYDAGSQNHFFVSLS